MTYWIIGVPVVVGLLLLLGSYYLDHKVNHDD